MEEEGSVTTGVKAVRWLCIYVCGESLRRESARAYLSEAEQVAGYKPRPHCGPLPLHLPPFSCTPKYVCTHVCMYHRVV